MIGLKGTLNIIDNSGAPGCRNRRCRTTSAARVRRRLGLRHRRQGPQRGTCAAPVIVRTRKAVRRPDGRLIRFDDNAAVLLNNKREMLGTRIGGVVSADLRMKGWGQNRQSGAKSECCLLNLVYEK
ncbi:ribosomal protein L14 domain-containing protein [Mycena olivaceomarginata]|nr:ribosomal protein L14 domain-containing protein [Mycena olivaceomarginata]